MHDDFVAVFVDARSITSQYHGALLFGKPYAGQRPKIMVIQTRGDNRDGRPILVHRDRFGPFTHAQTRQRVVWIDLIRIRTKHAVSVPPMTASTVNRDKVPRMRRSSHKR